MNIYHYIVISWCLFGFASNYSELKEKKYRRAIVGAVIYVALGVIVYLSSLR